MPQPDIKAEKINSPIQLMAAWFVMLILLSGVLLTAATKIEKPEWASGYLVISTTILILIVIIAVILMLTKYRPHLQEGKEYAEWLKEQNRYGKITYIDQTEPRTSLRASSDKLKTRILEVNSIDRKENAPHYQVSVSNLEKAGEIIEIVKEFNVATELNDVSNNTLEAHQSIWLGPNIPAEIAIPIIKKAVGIWPHLKYIAFPSANAPEYTGWQLYIGGSTSTAEQRGYRPWTNKEINSLQVKDTALFHEEIRRKFI